MAGSMEDESAKPQADEGIDMTRYEVRTAKGQHWPCSGEFSASAQVLAESLGGPEAVVVRVELTVVRGEAAEWDIVYVAPTVGEDRPQEDDTRSVRVDDTKTLLVSAALPQTPH